jgi:4-hydroxy-3-methylbut-2-enyl diphosphate reductase
MTTNSDTFDAGANDLLAAFHSPLVDSIRGARPAGVLSLPGGRLVLPEVFGFCRGVRRALNIAEQAVEEHSRRRHPGRVVLLGEIIHNPWANEHFRRRGVAILSRKQVADVEHHVRPDDCVLIPAFGVLPDAARRLATIGCRVVDCSCGDVIRLWRWCEQAAAASFGVVLFGRATHDETVVTKNRLAEAGGRFLVVENVEQARRVGQWLITGAPTPDDFRKQFNADATNADSFGPFERLALASQTTMLYDDTMRVCNILLAALTERFGPAEAKTRLRFQDSVCRATQNRQNAAAKLCRSGGDVIIVVGGFGSSNTRHLHQLAAEHGPAWLIEDAAAIRSREELLAFDPATYGPQVVRNWLPKKRPLRIGILAGASTPEAVVGEVLQELSTFLQ